MRIRNVGDLEPAGGEQRLRLVHHPLAVGEGAGGLVGDFERRRGAGRLEPEPGQELAHVPGQRRDAPRALATFGVVAEQGAVILDHGAAARRVDDHRIQPRALDLAGPGFDVDPGGVPGGVMPAEMMGERAAAAGVRHHHLAAVAHQHADGRRVDAGRQGLLHAARQQRDAGAARALGGVMARPAEGAGRRRAGASKGEHGFEAPRHQRCERGREPGQRERAAEPRRVRQHPHKHAAQDALKPRPGMGFLDHPARVIDQMHVIDPRGAGGHAGQAGQAAVDMPRHHLPGAGAGFQHVLDQIDAPARPVELVAGEHIGRTRRGAEPAMHAGTQDRIRLGDIGVFELGRGEVGLHPLTPPRTCGRG